VSLNTVKGGFIDVNLGYNNGNSVSTFENTKIFYVSTPLNLGVTKSSIEDNRLKTVNVSEVLDLNLCSKFYPLDLVISGEDRKINDKFETILTIKSRFNEFSKRNFRNKHYKIIFYEKGTFTDEVKTKEFEFDIENNDYHTIDVSEYRDELGINFTSTSSIYSTKTLRYEYVVTDNIENVSKTYGNFIEGDTNAIKYNAIIRFLG
jgi:hypothetical protein